MDLERTTHWRRDEDSTGARDRLIHAQTPRSYALAIPKEEAPHRAYGSQLGASLAGTEATIDVECQERLATITNKLRQKFDLADE